MAETRTASPVSWFEVHSPDTTRAKAFYGELFGWTFSEAGPDYSLVGLGDDAPIGGGIAPLIEGQAPMAIICVQVEAMAGDARRSSSSAARSSRRPRRWTKA